VVRTVNPQMITLARECRDKTQGVLAREVNISQGKLSKYENGMLAVSDLDIAKISRVLDFDVNFFYQRDELFGLGSTFVFNRKRQAVSMRIQKSIQAQANVMRMQAERLLRGAEIVGSNRFEQIDAETFNNNPERIARYVRAVWCLPLGPIPNVTRVVESAGGIIFKFPFGTDKIDAVHMWPPGLPPLFFMNSEMPGDRYRFNLAHELGHAIMHRNVTEECESEANRFASEFLMPREEIGKHLDSMTLEKAARLKAHWRVSMHAIVYRAHAMQKISDRLYTRLMQSMGAKGYRTREPVEIPQEDPNTANQLLKVHKEHHGYSGSDLRKLLFRYDPQFFSEEDLPAPPATLKLFVG
jgi:Zn-dependent peptidase ImmA (M78 family)